jgi:hypothetical protein
MHVDGLASDCAGRFEVCLARCRWKPDNYLSLFEPYQQLGFYFQGHTASRVIFILNTLFDSGMLEDSLPSFDEPSLTLLVPFPFSSLSLPN